MTGRSSRRAVRTGVLLAVLAAVAVVRSTDRVWLAGALDAMADGPSTERWLGIAVGASWIVVGVTAIVCARRRPGGLSYALTLTAVGLTLVALWSAPSRRAGRTNGEPRDIEGDPWNVLVDDLLPGFHDGWLVGLAIGMAAAFVLASLDRAGSRRR